MAIRDTEKLKSYMSQLTEFKGKRILVTGHTGFKGAWLCQWLVNLGADVTGYALAPPTRPSLFDLIGLGDRIKDRRGDVRDLAALQATIELARPEVVFHLAAQPLVLNSYEDPVYTFETNVTGTANVLEAVRRSGRPCVVIVVTSDKCYAPSDTGKAFVEDDPLGGKDPYSASKAAAEIVVSSYRDSYFASSSAVKLASVRAGNVVGGGDWAMNRILTDAVNALVVGQAIPVRNPLHVRPWQHVLEPLSGYMTLAAHLLTASDAKAQGLTSAWNFGPLPGEPRTVREVVELLISSWGSGQWQDLSRPDALVETKLLNISPAKAMTALGWKPVLTFEQTIRETALWYRAWADGAKDLSALCNHQIELYTKSAAAQAVAWAL